MLKSSKLSDRFKKKPVEIDDKISSIPFKTAEKTDKAEISKSVDIEEILIKSLFEKIDSIPVWFEYSPEKQKDLIMNFVDIKLAELGIQFQPSDKQSLIEKLFNQISGFGPLDYLLSQENVSAVFVNGNKNVHIEIGGKILNTEIKISTTQLNLILNNIFALCAVERDRSKPVMNLKNDKFFITIITPPVCENGINIVIQKVLNPDVNTFFEKNITSKEIFDFLVSAVAEYKNIVISGDINSGKTFLLDVLINSTAQNKRSAVIEEYPCISASGENLMKFLMPDDSSEFKRLNSNILKLSPEYIFTDINVPVCNFTERNGYISTLRASTVEAAITKLTSAFMSSENLTEKYARAKVLTDIDYIVQINKMKDGYCKVTSVVGLKPARTLSASVNTIAKLVDGHYITEIPQPLTSIRAESLIAQSGSMYSRFYNRG